MSRSLSDAMNMSLDQLISANQSSNTHNNNNNRGRGRAAPVSLAIKGSTSSNRRATRQGQNAPYDASHRSRNNTHNNTHNSSNSITGNANNGTLLRAEAKHESALKFLLSNNFAGTLIGNGGSSVRDLMDITDAAVHVSNHADYYPGTKERVIYITGPLDAVKLAQSLVWEMIGQQTDAQNSGNALSVVTWEPSQAKNDPGRFDDVEVTGRITIPANAGGLIVGRGGATIRSFADESGVDSLTIDNKEDGEITYERVLTLQGTVASCMKCTSLIVEKLQEGRNEVTHNYVCNGTGYAKVLRNGGVTTGNTHSHAHSHAHSYAGMSSGASVQGSISGGGGPPRIINTVNSNRRHQSSHYDNDDDFSPRTNPGRTVFSVAEKNLFDPTVKTGVCAETLSAHTTIELAVPDNMVGVLLGVQGSTLNEIIGLSGAKVVVSKRGELVEGTNNRLVTIVGSPACAQTAHTLIIHKLKQSMEEY